MERATAADLTQALDALAWTPEEAHEVLVEALENVGMDITRVNFQTFQEAGMMTMNEGIIISDGRTEVQMVLHIRSVR